MAQRISCVSLAQRLLSLNSTSFFLLIQKVAKAVSCRGCLLSFYQIRFRAAVVQPLGTGSSIVVRSVFFGVTA